MPGPVGLRGLGEKAGEQTDCERVTDESGDVDDHVCNDEGCEPSLPGVERSKNQSHRNVSGKPAEPLIQVVRAAQNGGGGDDDPR